MNTCVNCISDSSRNSVFLFLQPYQQQQHQHHNHAITHNKQPPTIAHNIDCLSWVRSYLNHESQRHRGEHDLEQRPTHSLRLSLLFV